MANIYGMENKSCDLRKLIVFNIYTHNYSHAVVLTHSSHMDDDMVDCIKVEIESVSGVMQEWLCLPV